ncbi:MAG: hypothetical protein P8Y91_05775, partial [Desulfuromonadales bacterium]
SRTSPQADKNPIFGGFRARQDALAQVIDPSVPGRSGARLPVPRQLARRRLGINTVSIYKTTT